MDVVPSASSEPALSVSKGRRLSEAKNPGIDGRMFDMTNMQNNLNLHYLRKYIKDYNIVVYMRLIIKVE